MPENGCRRPAGPCLQLGPHGSALIVSAQKHGVAAGVRVAVALLMQLVDVVRGQGAALDKVAAHVRPVLRSGGGGGEWPALRDRFFDLANSLGAKAGGEVGGGGTFSEAVR